MKRILFSSYFFFFFTSSSFVIAFCFVSFLAVLRLADFYGNTHITFGIVVRKPSFSLLDAIPSYSLFCYFVILFVHSSPLPRLSTKYSHHISWSKYNWTRCVMCATTEHFLSYLIMEFIRIPYFIG